MIQSVHRAAEILRALGSGQPRMGVTELAERLGLAKATVYGLLRTLEDEELVERDPETGRFRLGPALLQLGNAFLDNHELRGRAMQWADSLAERTKEAVRVGVPNGTNVLIIHHVFRPDNTLQILEVGAAIPWHASALGKAIAAFQEENTLGHLLQAPRAVLTGRTVVEQAELRHQLERARKASYAVEEEEAVLGEGEIGAPVLDHVGRPLGAIGVVGPIERVVPEAAPRADLIAAVTEVARGLSREMSGRRRYARSH